MYRVLSQYLDEYDNMIAMAAESKELSKVETTTNGANKAEIINNRYDINMYAHFDYNAFRDCFDARIFCY